MFSRHRNLEFCAVFMGLLLAASSANAQDPSEEGSTKKLAQDSQNPISRLVSVPFEYNTNYNAGPQNKTDSILTVKPVYPISFSENWNLINRALIPIVSKGARASSGEEVAWIRTPLEPSRPCARSLRTRRPLAAWRR